ncbi:MAG: hypothetical protein ACO1RT_13185 [Planctomycetaceae bacterium]
MSIGTQATVDISRCRSVAATLRNAALPIPKEDVPSLHFSACQEANLWFFLVAICHQTSPVGHAPLEGSVRGKWRKGWDYLLHAFLNAACKDLSLLAKSHWRQFSESEMQRIFGPKLTEPARRAELVRDLASTLDRFGWNSIIEAGPATNYTVANEVCNLIDTLASFEAYADPVQKKSVFFLSLMKNAGLWTYCDGDRLPAPIDYHELRGHLRIGTVRLEPELRERVVKGQPIPSDEDVAIRFAVREAVSCISEELKESPNALHYFFWNLFRTYCTRNSPKCDGSNFPVLTAPYAQLLERLSNCECPFRSICDSADLPLAINEPVTVTEYY